MRRGAMLNSSVATAVWCLLQWKTIAAAPMPVIKSGDLLLLNADYNTLLVRPKLPWCT